jgi:1-acyl-sn-glycerol-3-phosphate acyltransferase
MIQAKHHPLVYGFFKSYSRIRIRNTFQEVVVRGDVSSAGKPVMLLSNHISWWDGFWALYLNETIFGRKFHFMMDEEQLRKRWLFSYSGGFSIRPTSRSLFESLRYTEQLLTNPENLVIIFPQGKLYSSHAPEIHFKKGIERLRFDHQIQPDVYFLVQLTDYFQFEKPTLYFYLKKATNEDIATRSYELAYNQFYQQTLQQHSQLTV